MGLMRCLVIGLSASHQKYGKVPNKEKRGEIKEGLERGRKRRTWGIPTSATYVLRTYLSFTPTIWMLPSGIGKNVFLCAVFFYTSTYGSTKYRCCLVHLRSVMRCFHPEPRKRKLGCQ